MDVYIQDRESGIISDSEISHLNMLENTISERIDGLYAGRGIVCAKEYVFFMYYVNQKNAFRSRDIFNALSDSAFRPTQTDIINDPNGNEYAKFLLPDKYQLKMIDTNDILRKLSRYGDDGTRARDIKYKLLFENKDSMVEFSSQAFKNGFEYYDMVQEKTKDKVLPIYKLIVNKQMPFNPEKVNEQIKYLMKLAEEHGGEYVSLETNITHEEY
jgi:regulator of RNase E activity RraB